MAEGREHYRGALQDPPLGDVAKAPGINPLNPVHRWTAFEPTDARAEVDE